MNNMNKNGYTYEGFIMINVIFLKSRAGQGDQGVGGGGGRRSRLQH